MKFLYFHNLLLQGSRCIYSTYYSVVDVAAFTVTSAQNSERSIQNMFDMFVRKIFIICVLEEARLAALKEEGMMHSRDYHFSAHHFVPILSHLSLVSEQLDFLK